MLIRLRKKGDQDQSQITVPYRNIYLLLTTYTSLTRVLHQSINISCASETVQQSELVAIKTARGKTVIIIPEIKKPVKLAVNWWREPNQDELDNETDSAKRLWLSACNTLMAPNIEDSYKLIQDNSPPDTLWHSLKNCVAYQADVWQNLISKGAIDVIQPAAFKLAIVLRHTPPQITVQLLADLLKLHPQSQDITAYVMALLTDDESGCGSCLNTEWMAEVSSIMNGRPAPIRDAQLFGDCEVASLGAPPTHYDTHAALVRAEYAQLTEKSYIELRVRVLNQLSLMPQIFHTPEFEHLERQARENIEREISALRAELLTSHGRK